MKKTIFVIGSIFLLSCQTIQNRNIIINDVNIKNSAEAGELIFPQNWYEEPISGDFQFLTQADEFRRSVKNIKIALDQYPRDFLIPHVDNIYLFSELSFYGKSYATTSYSKTIYMCNEGLEKNYTDHFIQESVHHEIAGLIFAQYRGHFPLYSWREANPQQFFYGTGSIDSLREGRADIYLNEYYFEYGFLNQFAMSDVETDFKQYARFLFIDGNELFSLAENYPRIETKLNLVIQFYESIDNRLSYSYFKKIAADY